MVSPLQINGYKEKLYEETMVLVTEGAFSLVQVIPYRQLQIPQWMAPIFCLDL